MGDDELQRGIAFYEAHPDAPKASRKIEIAREVLSDREAWAEHEKTRPRTAFENEEAFQDYRREYLLDKMRELNLQMYPLADYFDRRPARP